jgi:PAS domain S-box-containing protein
VKRAEHRVTLPNRASELDTLRLEHAELRARLEEAEETLAAIRRGDVDALVVGEDIYTLDSANAAANRMRKDVLSQMEDAVLALDAEDHLIFMNAAAERQYGRPASEALGRARSALYRESWANPGDEVASRAALEASGTFRAQTLHVRHDGSSLHVESTVSRLRDAGGAPIGTLWVLRDVSERVRVESARRVAEEALREADRRKDEFLATLAHELRNPLAPISNALQILRLSHEPAVVGKAHGIIERQLLQMVHLVDDLLDVSRISQDKVVLRRAPVDVAAVVQNALETSRPLVDAGRHELTVRLPAPRTLTVDADVTRLTQIIANLLNNAAKYTPEGGRVEVSAQREGEQALICVKDSGVGIPPEMLPRVFDMFAQVDRSLERAQGGLGIGLALVRRLVEMHGGSVQVSSEGPGRGSTFCVRLPLAKAAAPAAEPALTQPLQGHDTDQMPVLIVDDNVDSADSLSRLLQMLGYRTRTANDGLEAVQLAEAFRPRVVLLDIGLPGLSGHDAARRIRAEPWGREMLLIALSGWGQDDDRRKSREAGFDHHFVKPVDLEALTALLVRLKPR